LRRASSVLGFLVLSVLLATSCLSAPARDNRTGVTDTEVLVGNWSPQSGAAASYGVVALGTDAYFKYVNDQGGIYGRKIKYLIEDDAYQPARTVAVVKKMVEQDGVFAFVGGLGTATNMAVKDYIVQHKVPNVGYATGSTALAYPPNPYFFALQTNYDIESRLLTRYAIDDLKAKRIGVIYQNDAFGVEGRDGILDELKNSGVEPAIVISYETTDTDFSSHAIKLRESAADVVILWSIPKPTALLLKEAEKIGFRPHWVSSTTNVDPIMFDTAGQAWDGAIVATWLPPFDSPDPKVSFYREVFKKYYPDRPLGQFSEIGFAYGQLFVEGLQRAGKDLNRESFIKAMESIKDWNGSLAFNVSYSPEDRQGQQAVAFARANLSTRSYEVFTDFRQYGKK